MIDCLSVNVYADRLHHTQVLGAECFQTFQSWLGFDALEKYMLKKNRFDSASHTLARAAEIENVLRVGTAYRGRSDSDSISVSKLHLFGVFL